MSAVTTLSAEARKSYEQATPSRSHRGDGLDITLPQLLAAAAITPGDPAIDVGVEASHVILCSVQLRNSFGQALAGFQLYTWWLSDAAFGAQSGTTPSGAAGPTTGAVVATLTAKLAGTAVSDVNGQAVIGVTNSSAHNYWLNVDHGGNTVSVLVPIA